MKLDYISDACFRRLGRAMTTAMAQHAQEPARWLSAKSRNKNRRAISHYKIAGTRARHTHPSDYKRGNKKKRQSPCLLELAYSFKFLHMAHGQHMKPSCLFASATRKKECMPSMNSWERRSSLTSNAGSSALHDIHTILKPRTYLVNYTTCMPPHKVSIYESLAAM